MHVAMKKYPFILNERYGDQKHIGVVIAGDNEELNAKIKQAIEAHFDGVIKEDFVIELDKVYLKYGEAEEFSVLMDEDGEESLRDIEIASTWIY